MISLAHFFFTITISAIFGLLILMTPVLYKLDFSPPARACMMACDIFNVDATMVDVNIMAQQHKTPQYLKMNPLHTVPVLKDGDLILHDSHAILMYLADVYGQDSTWYPKDVRQRALVNQKLFFDTSVTFPLVKNIINEAVKEGERRLTEKRKTEIEDAYRCLEEFLSRTKYIASNHITISDLSCIATMTTLFYILPHDAAKHPKTAAWVRTMGAQTFCKKYNESGTRAVGEWIKGIIQK